MPAHDDLPLPDSDSFRLGGLRFADGTTGDLLVENGRIVTIGAPAASGVSSRDISGWLCLPALVEAHVHLDKTFLGAPWQPHLPGAAVADRIRLEKLAQARLEVPIVERGSRLVEQELRFGTGFMRTHVDIDAEIGLGHFEAVAEIRRRYADRLDMQIVAFPQSGILASPGTAALLDEALAQGADLIGRTRSRQASTATRLAISTSSSALPKNTVRTSTSALHEGGALGVFELGLICGHVERTALAGKVTVSHAYCLGQLGAEELKRVGEKLAKAGVAILTAVPPVSMPPLKALDALGVTVLAASDNIRDAWAPFGNGDVLDRASMAACQQVMDTDEDLCFAVDLVTGNAARALRLDGYGLVVGGPANFVLVEAESVAQAVAAPPTRRMTFRRGRKIAEAGVPAA